MTEQELLHEIQATCDACALALKEERDVDHRALNLYLERLMDMLRSRWKANAYTG